MYDAVLFDLDGTLLNTLDDLTDAVNHTLRSFDYPTREISEVRAFVGNGIRRLIERVLPDGAANPDMEAALAEFKRYYTSHCNVRTRPYEGVVEAMAALDEVGIKLAIVSNKNDEAVKALAHDYFGSLVSAAIGGREGIARKPAPRYASARAGGHRSRTRAHSFLWVTAMLICKPPSTPAWIACW